MSFTHTNGTMPFKRKEQQMKLALFAILSAFSISAFAQTVAVTAPTPVAPGLKINYGVQDCTIVNGQVVCGPKHNVTVTTWPSVVTVSVAGVTAASVARVYCVGCIAGFDQMLGFTRLAAGATSGQIAVNYPHVGTFQVYGSLQPAAGGLPIKSDAVSVVAAP